MTIEVQIHNLKPENTTRIRAGIERAKTGGISEWKTESDSSSTGAITNPGILGVGLVFDHRLAWPLIMRDELATIHDIPIAGTGMVRTLDNTLVDDRWNLPSFGWHKQHKTFAYHTRNSIAPQFWTDQPGDHVTVLYYDGGTAEPGTFTITTPGHTPSIVASSSTPGWKKATRPGHYAEDTPTTLTKKTGPYMAPAAACVWNSQGGLLVHNVGQGGSSAHGSGLLNDRWIDDTKRESLGQVFADPRVITDQPLDALILAFGGNDKRLKVADHLIYDAIRYRRDKHPDTDLLLVAETQLADNLVPRPVWLPFLAGLHDLAHELDVPLIDQDSTLGPYTDIVANGQNADASGHLKPEVLDQLGRSTAHQLSTVI